MVRLSVHVRASMLAFACCDRYGRLVETTLSLQHIQQLLSTTLSSAYLTAFVHHSLSSAYLTAFVHHSLLSACRLEQCQF
jgi:hypothetical protein